VVGALFVANAVGEVVEADGSVLAGPRLEPGERREDLLEWMRLAGNTTIGVVATNAIMSKPDARRLAEAANDALDVAIRPAHTLFDGDTVFTLATKQVNVTYVDVAALVEAAVTTAIRRAVTS
jgi:L-aminopeptidase/D-esterase-like protein